MATPRLEVIVIFDVDDLDDNGRFSTKDVVAAIARFNELSPGCMDLGELSEASLSPCANIANLVQDIFHGLLEKELRARCLSKRVDRTPTRRPRPVLRAEEKHGSNIQTNGGRTGCG